MVVDAQFHKFYGRSFARLLYLPVVLMKDRSVTPLGAINTRVNRKILQGRCGPLPFCARVLYNPHKESLGISLYFFSAFPRPPYQNGDGFRGGFSVFVHLAHTACCKHEAALPLLPLY